MSCALSVSSSCFTFGITPALPAFFCSIGSCDGMLSPNSSFTSMTSALTSVESAIAISLCIRFALCAANRFTYNPRTIGRSAADAGRTDGVVGVAAARARAAGVGAQRPAAVAVSSVLRAGGFVSD